MGWLSMSSSVEMGELRSACDKLRRTEVMPALGRTWSRQRRAGTGRSASLVRSVLRPTALRCSVLRPRRRTHCVHLVLSVRTTATSQLTNRAAREAANPGFAGRPGPEALPLARHKQFCGETLLVFGVSNTRSTASRQAVSGGGDLWGGEKHRLAVGARSALSDLTRRGCPNGVRAAHSVSSATRPLAEHRSGVGACHRPPQCEPAPGTACRAARPIAETIWRAMPQPIERAHFMRSGSYGVQPATGP